MLQLSTEQQSILYQFVVDDRDRGRAPDPKLEKALAYIMSHANVRKVDLIPDQIVRSLVQSTFAILKTEYLLENGMITSLKYYDRIAAARARIRQFNLSSLK